MRLSDYLNEKRKTPRQIMYHGTSSKHLSSIMSKGLQYKGKDVEKVWDLGQTDKLNPSKASLEGIYLTNNILIASRSARDASNKFGGNPLYIVVIFQPLSGLPDEDLLTNTIRNSVKSTIKDFWGNDSNTFEQLSYLDLTLDGDKSDQYVNSFKTNLVKSIERFHDIKLDSRAIKNVVIEDMLVSELERLISYDLKANEMGSKTGFFKGYDIYGKSTVQDVIDNMPSPQQAEKKVLQLTDKFTQMFKDIRTDIDQFMYNLRSKESIKFKGRNRILSIVEELEEGQLKAHYGKVPDQFIKDYKDRIKQDAEIIK